MLLGGIVDEDVESSELLTVSATARSQNSLSPTSPAMAMARRPSASTICRVFAASSCSHR
jgi:hypothetical protein